MKYFTYIIKSQLDQSFYIGSTSNLETRLRAHNSGKSPYTSKKKPWEIVYFEEFGNKSDALKREKFLKKQRNKEFYQKIIKISGSRSSPG
jgi:putative endonuclease